MTDSERLKLPLTGIIPPMVTPLRQDMCLDVIGLGNLVEHLIAGGVSGLFVLGTTGEAASLKYSLRHELVVQTCKAVNGRVPVLVGITDTSIAESIGLAQTANESGAAAVVAAPPFYFNLSQKELFAYYELLAGEVQLPLFLYNTPSVTKMPIEVSTALRLAEHPNIVGLKDSSANSVYFQSLHFSLQTKPDFTLLVGPEEIMAESVLMGGHGGVSGGANMFPKLYVKLYEAAAQKDYTTAASLQTTVMEISSKLYSVGMYSASYLKSIKAALSLLNICDSYMAPPLAAFDTAEMGHAKPIIEGFKLTLEKRGLL